MSPANHRHLRVGEEIAHEINAMLVGELKDPRLEGMVVANEVRVQQDMKHARVFVSVRALVIHAFVIRIVGSRIRVGRCESCSGGRRGAEGGQDAHDQLAFGRGGHDHERVTCPARRR